MNDLRASTTPDCALLGFRLLVAIAAFIGSTRLIDNTVLE